MHQINYLVTLLVHLPRARRHINEAPKSGVAPLIVGAGRLGTGRKEGMAGEREEGEGAGGWCQASIP